MPTMHPKQSQRYFLLQSQHHPESSYLPSGSGLAHYRLVLKYCLSLAASLDRIAVVENAPLTATHNDDRPFSRNPKLYLDLDNARCYGESLPSSGAQLKYTMLKDFQSNKFTNKDILDLRATNKEQSSNKEYMRHKDYRFLRITANENNHGWYHTLMDSIPASKQQIVSLPWAENIYAMATEVMAQMARVRGADQRFKTVHHYYRRHYQIPPHVEMTTALYTCLHIRCGESTCGYKEYHRFNNLSTIKNIRRNLKEFPRRFNKNGIIYLMSNKPNLDYFEPLKKDYPNIMSYRDFPILEDLMRNDKKHTANNYLLCAVEYCLYSFAAYKISNRRPMSGWQIRQLTGGPIRNYLASVLLRLKPHLKISRYPKHYANVRRKFSSLINSINIQANSTKARQ